MEGDSEIRKREKELAALREEASRKVAAASSQERELTQEEDSQVLALMSQARALEDEIRCQTKRRVAD
jgi:hypothetical protein